jgi:hypothetical protein
MQSAAAAIIKAEQRDFNERTLIVFSLLRNKYAPITAEGSSLGARMMSGMRRAREIESIALLYGPLGTGKTLVVVTLPATLWLHRDG